MEQRLQALETQMYYIHVLRGAHAHVSICVVTRYPLSKRKPNRGSPHLVPQMNICAMHQQEQFELQLSPSPMLPYAAKLRSCCLAGPFAVWSVKNSMISE